MLFKHLNSLALIHRIFQRFFHREKNAILYLCLFNKYLLCTANVKFFKQTSQPVYICMVNQMIPKLISDSKSLQNVQGVHVLYYQEYYFMQFLFKHFSKNFLEVEIFIANTFFFIIIAVCFTNNNVIISESKMTGQSILTEHR